MRTHVEFRSSKFPAYPGEDEEINPGRWGRRLAEHLRDELVRRGFTIDGLVTEDWGCVVSIAHTPFALWIGCGNSEEYDDGFLCFIEPSKPTVWRWFRRHDTRMAVARVADALNEILTSDSDIRDVRWVEPVG